MTLYYNLLKDFNNDIKRHILLGCDLHNDNLRKFSLVTHKHIVSVIERVQESISTSKRIGQDINYVVKRHILTIIEHRDAIVPSLEKRKDRRDINTKKISSNWSGLRKRKSTVAVKP